MNESHALHAYAVYNPLNKTPALPDSSIDCIRHWCNDHIRIAVPSLLVSGAELQQVPPGVLLHIQASMECQQQMISSCLKQSCYGSTSMLMAQLLLVPLQQPTLLQAPQILCKAVQPHGCL